MSYFVYIYGWSSLSLSYVTFSNYIISTHLTLSARLGTNYVRWRFFTRGMILFSYGGDSRCLTSMNIVVTCMCACLVRTRTKIIKSKRFRQSNVRLIIDRRVCSKSLCHRQREPKAMYSTLAGCFDLSRLNIAPEPVIDDVSHVM